MKIRGLLLVLAMFGAPGALVAQDSAPAEERERSRHRGPVEMLLLGRERLGLSEEQVARLEAIGNRMEERNRPLVARLLEMRRQLRAEFRESPREMERSRRQEYERRVESARPLLREIRENNRSAMREVGEVLTPAQKQEVRSMLREHRQKKGHDGERRRRGHRS